NGERVKAAVGEVVAACVSFDQASGSMSPIMIPEVVRSKIS
ncbi:MAG TPA: 4-hydroxybenzoyl-CoA thioesterase, partial [Opitutae bacterium]|nr:4-hydroxybenzoyl-CoA thioesterase [Opitutae bacterium]